MIGTLSVRPPTSKEFHLGTQRIRSGVLLPISTATIGGVTVRTQQERNVVVFARVSNLERNLNVRIKICVTTLLVVRLGIECTAIDSRLQAVAAVRWTRAPSVRIRHGFAEKSPGFGGRVRQPFQGNRNPLRRRTLCSVENVVCDWTFHTFRNFPILMCCRGTG